METRLTAVVASELPGVCVSGLCAELGISRKTLYQLRRRFREEGPAGLEPRSRRPHRSPNATPAAVEDEIVRLRKQLPLDNGAQAIAFHLARLGAASPSVRTVHRVLVRRGMVVPAPAKRPRSSWHRFEFAAPNACWQIDATAWPLAGGAGAWVMDVLDDHSRVSVAALACGGPTAAAAWGAFAAGVAVWGVPAMVLSDNGVCFTARGRGRSAFEEALGALGVRTVTSSPHHPQTCGKIERFHQTLKRWLRARPLAATPARLQAQLDEFRAFYNEGRPHKALGGATPVERFGARAPARPEGGDQQSRPVLWVGAALVDRNGVVAIGKRHSAGVGTEHRGRRLTVVRYGLRVVVLHGHEVVARLTVDPTRRYQPSGKPRGGPRRSP